MKKINSSGIIHILTKILKCLFQISILTLISAIIKMYKFTLRIAILQKEKFKNLFQGIAYVSLSITF